MQVDSRILVENYEDIGCNLREGYAPTVVTPQRYLGNKKSFDRRNTIIITKLIENGEDANSFFRWWREDLQFGTLPFQIEIPFMGGLAKIDVIMENDLSPIMEGTVIDPVKVPMTLKVVDSAHTGTISIVGISQVGGANSCVYDDPQVGCTVQTVYMVEVLGTQQGDINYKWTSRGATIVAGQGTDSVTIETTGTADVSYGITVDVSDDVYTLYASISAVHNRESDLPVPITIASIDHVAGEISCSFNTSDGCSLFPSYSATLGGDVVGSLVYLWEVTGLPIQSGQGTDTIVLSDIGSTTLDTPYTVKLTVTDDQNTDNTEIQTTHTRTNTNQAPVITLVGGDRTVDLGGEYIELGATASDVGDGDITHNIVTNSNVDTSQVGTYQVTYNVTDSLGVAADEVTRTVIVASDINSIIYEMNSFITI